MLLFYDCTLPATVTNPRQESHGKLTFPGGKDGKKHHWHC